MTPSPATPIRGYTLPVWVAAAARAATGVLVGEPPRSGVPLELLEPAGPATVPVEAASELVDGWALAESRCDPGDGLDLTRGLVVWVLARWRPLPGEGPSGDPGSPEQRPGCAAPGGPGAVAALATAVVDHPLAPLHDPLAPGPAPGALADPAPARGGGGAPAQAMGAGGEQPWLELAAGEGVGLHADSGAACLSAYAHRLLAVNLRPLVPPGRTLQLRVVLPAGRALATRTSNAAFGVVDGLALIGTRAETQASADPDQLERTLATLRRRLADPAFAGDLVLVIGENGLDLAPRLGLPASLLLKAGNWLGPVLVAAGQGGVRRLLLFGYQGKLLKLAAGIFHTHHHLADGRAEVLTALAALEGLGGASLRRLFEAPTVEAALAGLEAEDAALAQRLRDRLAAAIESRSASYLARHAAAGMAVGAVLFDRARRIRAAGPIGAPLLASLSAAPPSPPDPRSAVGSSEGAL